MATPTSENFRTSMDPSSRNTSGSIIMLAPMEMLANSESSDDSTMYFLEMTLRDCSATFDAIAVRNPYQLNDRSVADAITTPATMGISVSVVTSDGTEPRNIHDSSTVKNGSSDLIVCVRDTFTAPRDMFVNRNPSRCIIERGTI
eukprot:1194470-Prorocentrum_minimum.AAC.5